MIRKIFVLSVILVCAIISLSLPSTAQQVNNNVLRIRSIDLDEQQTPEYDVRRVNLGSSKVREWAQILVEFDSAPEWIDQLDFTYYALVKSEESPTGYLLFRGSVAYVNIERGSHQSVMYIHPSTVERFGKVERMAVVVQMNGQLVGMSSEPSSRARWWEQLTPVDGYLLNRLLTPFSLINYDNYPAIKSTSRN